MSNYHVYRYYVLGPKKVNPRRIIAAKIEAKFWPDVSCLLSKETASIVYDDLCFLTGWIDNILYISYDSSGHSEAFSYD